MPCETHWVTTASPVSLGFFTDLAIRRLEGSVVTRNSDHWTIVTPENPTFYWGNFVLFDETARMPTPTDLVTQFHDAFPEAAHVAIGIDGPREQDALADAFRSLGFDADHAVILTAEPSAVVARQSPDVEIRQLVSDNDWAAFVEVGMATREPQYEEMAYRRYLEDAAAILIRQRAVQRGRAHWWGAFDGATLCSHAGLYDCGQGIGRFQSIATAPAYQRHGLATAVIGAAVAAAQASPHFSNLVIVADPDYHAVDLYRSLGFRDRERQLQIQRGA